MRRRSGASEDRGPIGWGPGAPGLAGEELVRHPDAELKQMAANVILLDRTLAHYGPETKNIRDQIRRAIAHKLAMTWPEAAPSRERTSRRTRPRWKASRTRSGPSRRRTTPSVCSRLVKVSSAPPQYTLPHLGQ